MASLAGKKIVIVGGSSGIGLGVAAAALQNGADVTIVGRSNDKLQTARQSLGASSNLQGIVADMTKEAEVTRLFGEVGSSDLFFATT